MLRILLLIHPKVEHIRLLAPVGISLYYLLRRSASCLIVVPIGKHLIEFYPVEDNLPEIECNLPYPLKKISSITTKPMDIIRDIFVAFQSDGTGSVHEILLSNLHTGLHVTARIAATSIANTRLKMFGIRSARLNIKT